MAKVLAMKAKEAAGSVQAEDVLGAPIGPPTPPALPAPAKRGAPRTVKGTAEAWSAHLRAARPGALCARESREVLRECAVVARRALTRPEAPSVMARQEAVRHRSARSGRFPGGCRCPRPV